MKDNLLTWVILKNIEQQITRHGDRKTLNEICDEYFKS